MKKLSLFGLLASLAILLAGCSGIAEIERARASREQAITAREQAKTAAIQSYNYRDNILQEAITERANILATQERSFYATLLALQQGQISMAQALAQHAPGTGHDGGITASVDVGAGIGWPSIFVLLAAALAAWGLLISLYRRDKRQSQRNDSQQGQDV